MVCPSESDIYNNGEQEREATTRDKIGLDARLTLICYVDSLSFLSFPILTRITFKKEVEVEEECVLVLNSIISSLKKGDEKKRLTGRSKKNMKLTINFFSYSSSMRAPL